MKKYGIGIIAILIVFILFSRFKIFTYGLDMESPEYKIQYGNVNIGAKPQSSTDYNLTTTVGQLAANEFNSTGYIVKAGFQYIYSIIPFSFSLSNIAINFGSLIPNTTATGTTMLTVSAGGAGGYQVTVAADTPLQSLSTGTTIPNTSCDAATPCSVSGANIWNSTSAYGFGYNMNGQDIPADFINISYNRPFSILPNSPATVMSSSKVTMPSGTPTPAPPSGRTHQSTMTFKVNVSANQQTGNYQSIIKFTATPIY